jgi:hypothetical protein
VFSFSVEAVVDVVVAGVLGADREKLPQGSSRHY